MGVMRIMHNSPNRGVNYHIFQNKGNYAVIPIYGPEVNWLQIGDVVQGTKIDHRFFGHRPCTNSTGGLKQTFVNTVM